MYPPITHNYANKNARLAQNSGSCSNWPSDQEVVQFRPNHHDDAVGSDDSGFCSPPLWKGSPSPGGSPSQPLLSHHIHSSLSPNSRIQAIVRGQRELMEMVKSMPESSYELSLKDLVEHHRVENQAPQVERLSDYRNQGLEQRGLVRVKRQESKKNEKNLMKSGSFENKGLFLMMVFPFSFSSKRKKNIVSSSSGKVSPKPEVVKGGGGERDWWKKKFTGSSDSDSSRTSNNSGSGGGSSSGRSYGGGRKRNGFLTGCWPLFQSRRSKSVE